MSKSFEIPYDLQTIYGICTDCITDDLMDIYSEMCAVFTNLSYSGHVTELDYIETMLISQSISRSFAVDSVLEVMITAAEECLHVIGVSINPETPIAIIPKLMAGLLEFDATDTPQFMMAIVADSEGPVECVCDLLEHITGLPSDTWLDVITGVEVKTIDAINYQLKLASDKQDTLVSEPVELRDKSNAVKQVFDDVRLLDISTESSSLEDLYGLHIASIVDMDPDTAVKEILGLAVMSNESSSTVNGSIDLILDDLFYNPTDRIRINSKVNEYKRQIEHLLSSKL